ncbi:hypothetical protein MMC25_000687 [Agyrium rufum]|nr:hypothetical protein [Agyrium rufum]
MGPNGSGPGSNAGDHHGAQSHTTEYTLQGVMRFLQVEWHRHERDRNAWEIERAEMRQRIAKLEGEANSRRRMQEMFEKHIKMLESALRKEREKVKNLQAGRAIPEKSAEEKESGKQEVKSAPKQPPTKPHNSFFELGSEEHDTQGPELRQDAERDKSRIFLARCLQEVTYHVLSLQNGVEEQEPVQVNQQFPNHQQNQSVSEDIFPQARFSKPQTNHITNTNTSSIPNHQPPPVPEPSEPALRSRRLQQVQARHADSSSEASRNHVEPPITAPRRSMTAIDTRDPPRISDEEPPAESEEPSRIMHSFDAWGQEVAPREEVEQARIIEEPEPPENDGWNFDDAPEPNHTQDEPPPPEYPLPQRPDTDLFPSAQNIPLRNSPQSGSGSHRKKSLRRHSNETYESSSSALATSTHSDPSQFKVRFALRGHLDVVRSVIFTGGGSPSEPELCTAGDDGVVKRWVVPAGYNTFNQSSGGNNTSASDLDISSYFTHRGHAGAVLTLAAAAASQSFSNGGRAMGDGWVFSGGVDGMIRVWERGRVDPKATIEGHDDAIWSVCVLPGTSFSALRERCTQHGGPDRIVLVSGSADGVINIWAVTPPPAAAGAARTGTRGGRRANSVSAGSNFPTSPQPTTASSIPFAFSLVHRITRTDHAAPTSISSLSQSGDSFAVAFNNASVIVYDTSSAEEGIGMASQETYDGTPNTAVNAVVATTTWLEEPGRDDEGGMHSATGSTEVTILSGHEDRYIRFFDANSGQCTYNMLAHPSAISSLSVSPDGRELVSAGHDASLRFWSLQKRACTQEITSHRLMRGEGICAVVWSQDGRFVVGAGGDGVVKVFGR